MITLLTLVACGGGGGGLDPYLPSVTFSRLDLTAIDWEAISVNFVFDVYNPDPVNLPLDRFAYDLSLGGVSIVTGDDPDGLLLEAEASSEVLLPVTLSFEGIYEFVQATRGEDYIDFGLAGSFGWDTEIGPIDIAFDEGGSFPALRAPEIEIESLVLADYDYEQAEFDLGLLVDNDQGSNMDFTNLDYNVKFAGTKVSSGTEQELGTASGASTSRMTVPVSVDYLDAVDAIAAAVSGDEIKVDLSATTDVSTPFGIVALTIDENGNISVGE
jgi:LEA14-like dessication related protein